MHGTFDLGDIRIGLWLTGFDEDPERISELLGLEADHIVRRGQCFPPPCDTHERAVADHWGIRPALDLTVSASARLALGDLLRPLRETLACRRNRLAALAGCTLRSPVARCASMSWSPATARSRR